MTPTLQQLPLPMLGVITGIWLPEEVTIIMMAQTAQTKEFQF